jgi:very-short-patch-repair endonuclease
MQSSESVLIHSVNAAPSLPFTGRVDRRSRAGWGSQKREKAMANARARSMHKAMTPQEVKLWVQLRKLRPQGFHFRRQAPLEGYILDFVCFKFRVIVEADGSRHAEDARLAHDARRDAHFAELGFRTLRFWNHEIDADLDAVIQTIVARAREAELRP